MKVWVNEFMRRINWPIAILSIILVIAGEIFFLLPNVRGSDETGIDAIRLGSLEYASDCSRYITSYKLNGITDQDDNLLGNGTVISWSPVSETIQADNYIRLTYPINIDYTNLTGKFVILNELPDDDKRPESIIHVKIIGDRDTIIYKKDWDVKKVSEIIIDEPLDKIRQLKIELRNSEKIRGETLDIAMLDFTVSVGGDPVVITDELKDSMNQSLVGSWGGTISKSGSHYNEILININSVQDGTITDAVITLSQDRNRSGKFTVKGTIDYETRTINLLPDKWINEPNIEDLNQDAYAKRYEFFPILVKLNENQNILRDTEMNLVIKKLVQGGQK